MIKIGGIANVNFDFSDITEIKRYLLLFDVVGVPALAERIQKARQEHDHACETRLAAEQLDYLLDNGVLFDVEMKGHGTIRQEYSTPENIKQFYAHLNQFQELAKTDYKEKALDAYLRLQSFVMSITEPPLEFEVLPILKQFTLPPAIEATKKDVVNIVIQQFPFPDEKITWEQLVEFKKEKDNIGRLAGLRTWINNMAKSGLTAGEISDELEYNLYKFRQSMDAHKIKYNTGIVETFVIGSGELLENIAKLKFKDVAKSLFAAKASKADLLLTELSTPGHELGYICKLEEKFGMS